MDRIKRKKENNGSICYIILNENENKINKIKIKCEEEKNSYNDGDVAKENRNNIEQGFIQKNYNFKKEENEKHNNNNCADFRESVNNNSKNKFKKGFKNDDNNENKSF